MELISRGATGKIVKMPSGPESSAIVQEELDPQGIISINIIVTGRLARNAWHICLL